MFQAKIRLLAANPYVLVPALERRALFRAAGRQTGPIPVKATLDGIPFRQTLVKYRAAWRLYLNTPMRRATGKDVGDTIHIHLEYDPRPRREPLPPLLKRAFHQHPHIHRAYKALTPSRQKEISRYLNNLTTDASRARNLQKIISYLSGESDGTDAAFLRTRPPKAKPT